jgi:hypothetical protein
VSLGNIGEPIPATLRSKIRTPEMEQAFLIEHALIWIAVAVFGGLVSVTIQLHRIANALKEANKLRSRKTQP